MTDVNSGRTTASVDDDFVVFVIGLRIHALWKVHKWLPIPIAMRRMISELESDPESGFLGQIPFYGFRDHVFVQYWESFEALREYAWDPDADHYAAMGEFWQNAGSDEAVGIWHETYEVSADEFEAVYINMPDHGLGSVGEVIPATGEQTSAAGRMGLTDGTDVPLSESGGVGPLSPGDDRSLSEAATEGDAADEGRAD